MGCWASKTTEKEKIANYSNLDMARVKTGDVVLFADDSKPSRLGNRITWTHCAVVVCSPNLYPRRQPMLLEFGNFDDSIEDISSHTKKKSGARLVDMATRVNSAAVDHIELVGLDRVVSSPEDLELAVQRVVAEVTRSDYDRPLESLTEELPQVVIESAGHLVAFALQRIGVLPERCSLTTYTPNHFRREKINRKVASGRYSGSVLLKNTQYIDKA